jgi:hypothetical protein
MRLSGLEIIRIILGTRYWCMGNTASGMAEKKVAQQGLQTRRRRGTVCPRPQQKTPRRYRESIVCVLPFPQSPSQPYHGSAC